MPVDIRGNTFYRAEDFKDIKELRDQLIPGLRCPDCGAESFQTNNPGIAVCGDYPGWFFLYEQEMEENKLKYKNIIVDGELQTVPVYKTQTIKKHP